MTIHETRLTRRAKSLLLVAIATCAVAIAMLGGATEKASAYWVCGPAAEVWRAPDFRCNHDTKRPSLRYIEKRSSPRGYGVYRSETRNGSSAHGTEYYSPTSDYYILYYIGCPEGYPNAHNLHPVPMYVWYTHAGSC